MFLVKLMNLFKIALSLQFVLSRQIAASYDNNLGAISHFF